MDYYLFIARSATQAQQVMRVLRQCGIRGDMVRAPAGLTDRGCSHAVRVWPQQVNEARACLKKAQLTPLHIFARENGSYREVET